MTLPGERLSVAGWISEAVTHFDDADDLSAAAHILLGFEAGSTEVHLAAHLLCQSGLRTKQGVAAVREAFAESLVPGIVPVAPGSSSERSVEPPVAPAAS